MEIKGVPVILSKGEEITKAAETNSSQQGDKNGYEQDDV